MSMELKIITAQNQAKGSIKLPSQFEEEIRADLIQRAVFAIQSATRQPYGAKPDAGMRQMGKLSRRRRDWRTSYGHGISRVPRKIMSRRGERFGWMGAVAPGTVKGRRAHPPKASKMWEQKINRKERKKAIRSAMAATLLRELVKQRGHLPPESYPFALDDQMEQLSKSKDVHQALVSLGLSAELERAAKKSVRAGKGKTRGRPYKKRKGPLLVVSGDCPLLKGAQGIPGVDVVSVERINALLLAPGAAPARLTLFTHKALKNLAEKRLFA